MNVLTGRTAISASAASEDEEGGAAMSLVAAMRGAQRLCDAHGGRQSWLLAPYKENCLKDKPTLSFPVRQDCRPIENFVRTAVEGLGSIPGAGACIDHVLGVRVAEGIA